MWENNIGYLNVRGFGMTRTALDEIDAAMNGFKDSEALVLDLRECRGGAVPALDRLLNYLTGTSHRWRVHTAPEFVAAYLESPATPGPTLIEAML